MPHYKDLVRPDINDDTWRQTSSLNTNQCRMSTVNRQKGRGVGLALVHKREIKVKLKDQEVDDHLNLEMAGQPRSENNNDDWDIPSSIHWLEPNNKTCS